MNHQRTHLDLFSGIGGFAIAAQNCGYTTIGFCEKEPYAQQIIKERFGAVLADSERGGCGTHRQSAGVERMGNGRQDDAMPTAKPSPRLHPDIFTLNGADYAGVDLLTGGFPCQPFSVAGKRRGAADDRALWPEMLRVVDGAKPTWIIGENVAGIVSMELDNILSDLESLGYSAWPLVIPACAVDARHRRDRVWIIGHRLLHPDAGRDQRAESERQHEWAEVSCGGGTNELEAGADVADTRHLRGRRRSEPAGEERAQVADDGQAVADAKRTRPQGQRIAGSTETGGGSPERADELATRRGDEDVAHADSQRGCVRQVHGEDASDARQSPATWKDERDWFAESGMGRVAHGIPHRAHRLRGLGNSICPPVAEEIIRAIASLR